MKKITIFGLLALLVIGMIATGVSAFRGDSSVKGPNFDVEIHEQLEAAMESGDYNTWLSVREENNLPMNGRMFSVVNEENFDLFVQMHEANELGDYETAQNIREELGLGLGSKGMNRGQGMGKAFGEQEAFSGRGQQRVGNCMH
jgi:hypothetical protein